MLPYFVTDPDEAENIVRFGLTQRQAACNGGICRTGVVIWLVDILRRFDLQKEACLEVEVADGDEVVGQLSPQPAFKLLRSFEGCAGEVAYPQTVRRRSANIGGEPGTLMYLCSRCIIE
jgi:hypothetical protein